MLSLVASIIISSLNQIGFWTFECIPTLKVFNAVSETAAISLDYINLTE